MATIELQKLFFNRLAKDIACRDHCSKFFQQATTLLKVKGDESVGVVLKNKFVDRVVQIDVNRIIPISQSDIFTSLTQITNPADIVCIITVDDKNNPTSMVFVFHTGVIYQFLLSGDEYDIPAIYHWIDHQCYAITTRGR